MVFIFVTFIDDYTQYRYFFTRFLTVIGLFQIFSLSSCESEELNLEIYQNKLRARVFSYSIEVCENKLENE